ncbi:alpha/beta fold hydrolase [Leisingera sp. M658]|uniref:alpha/beta fold hydrolase n=1 Tax=Leisingera sp. M658 TaxID=2867015 RepID=UPI0021A67557|nr:alpha/beta hydrolase [Leisingera sp. M658]UWQ75820.1 alpha/beta hydrolase [Leisingera sp. M658]
MLNYHRYGTGKTFVMQHGFLGGGGYFAPQMAALGQSFDMIAPDLPGYAGSAAEPALDSIEALSQAQVALLDKLGVERFSLLGHSMGGMIALQTALDHPDRVEQLVLYATHCSGNLPGRFETFDETAKRAKAEGIEALAKRVSATWFVDYDRAPMYPFCLGAGAGASEAAVLGSLKAFQTWDVTERLSELEMPVLVISGDKDRSYGVPGLVQLASGIKNASLNLISGGAHCVHLEKSDLFNISLREFLTVDRG